MNVYKQVNFSCPVSLYSRLKRQKELHERSILDLIVSAIEDKLKTLEGEGEKLPEPEQGSHNPVTLLPKRLDRVVVNSDEELYWVNLWRKFMRKMPREYVQAQQTLIRDSLRFFASARLKTSTREGEADGETRTK